MTAKRKPSLDRIVTFLPVFARPRFWFAKSVYPRNDWPYFRFSPEARRFLKVLHEDGWIQMFDWGAWQPRAIKLYRNPRLLGRVGLPTLQRLLTLHVRKERFCTGHLENVFASGHLRAILERIDELHRAERGKKTPAAPSRRSAASASTLRMEHHVAD